MNNATIVNDNANIARRTSLGTAFAAAEALSGVTEVARVDDNGLVIETFYFIDGIYVGVVKAGEKWGAALTAAIAAAC